MPRSVAVLTAVLLLIGSPDGLNAQTTAPVFREERAIPVDLGLLPKWQAVLARHSRQSAAPDPCEPDFFTRCPRQEWQDVLGLGDPASGERATVQAVNAAVNRQPYRTDRRNWGRDDFWATPLELFDRGGDCEDYAVAKYIALRALGVPASAMYVVVVRDRRRDRAHAILTIVQPSGTEVLDNEYAGVVGMADIPHYQPIYAVNAKRAFVFQASSAYHRLISRQGKAQPAS